MLGQAITDRNIGLGAQQIRNREPQERKSITRSECPAGCHDAATHIWIRALTSSRSDTRRGIDAHHFWLNRAETKGKQRIHDGLKGENQENAMKERNGIMGTFHVV